MARVRPIVRDSVPDDAEALLSIWRDFTSEGPRQPDPGTDIDDVRRSLQRIEDDPIQRLLVAVVEDEPVGVAHLRRAPLSPLHGEDAVHVGYLHVLSKFRRRGLGRQLIDAAASWAEELGSMHVVASVGASARDSNRFLARLGMSQVAVVRAATVTALRTKLHPASETAAPAVVSSRRLRRLSASRAPAGK